MQKLMSIISETFLRTLGWLIELKFVAGCVLLH